MKAKRLSKLTAWLLTLVMLMIFLPGVTFTAFAADDLIDNTTDITLRDADGDEYYEIGTADELMAFANLVNGGNDSISIELVKDINMTGKEWSTILYCGNVDGAGHTISNLEMIPTEIDGEYFAGFLYTQFSTVENIYFKNCSAVITEDIESTRDSYAAIIAPAAILSTFENCTAIDCRVAQDGSFENMSYAGGLIGIAAPSNVNFCSYQGGTVSAATTGHPSYVGGLVGNMWDVMAEEDPDNWQTVTISNSFCSADLSADSTNGIVGGILGYDAQELLKVSHIYENCYFSGDILSASVAGGLVGDNCARSTISNCAVLSGEIVADEGDPFAFGEWAQKDTYVTYSDLIICEDTKFVAYQTVNSLGKHYLSDLYLNETWDDAVSTISFEEADAYQVADLKSNLYGSLQNGRADVTIALSNVENEYTAVTDADGEYNFGKQILPGEYTLSIAKTEDYEAYEATVTINYAENKELDISRTVIAATAPTISAVSADLTNDNALTYGEITAEDKLTVTAEADSNTEYNVLEYQWYKAVSASSKDNAIAISGATNETYAIPIDTAVGDYYYYCAVTATRTDNGEVATAETEIISVTILPKTINTAISLPAPASNAAPQTTIDTDEYTAAVVWSPEVTDKFAYNTAYTATITITPKANYTVTGILENSYTVNGAETVTNAADSESVIVTYAKTGRRLSGGGGGTVLYTVKFETNGGSKIADKTVQRNAAVTEPEAPAKKGYSFIGWFTDEELTAAYDFGSKVTNSFTLYAKWAKHDDETPVAPEGGSPFADVKPGDWYYEDARYAVENGLFNGTTTTTFAPDGIITRAMMVTVLYRNEGEPEVTGTVTFEDIDSGAYYAKAVVWGQQNGIIKGYSETEFAPDQNITREQIAAIMHRYAEVKGIDVSVGENTNILSYTDFDSISEYAVISMQYAVGSGLMKGKTETTLNPKDNATRAEIAAILHRFMKGNENTMAPVLLYQGHGSVRIETPEGKVIYIDPYAGEGYDLPADLILVTHGHSDHNKIELIEKQNDDCVIITHEESNLDGVHQSFDLGYVKVEAVEAENKNHNIKECVGYILTFSNGKQVYFTGDTSTTNQMSTLVERKIDYAFYCCDGKFNMDRAEAAKCAEVVGAKYNIPYHMAPGSNFDRTIAEEFDAPGRIILEDGQTLVIE